MRKPAGSFRVAVLGDAFVEARQVDAEKTFWRLLGRNLGSCIALGGKQVEVLNFGIGGYATTEELLTLRRDVLRFSPDLVLLGFFADNDVHDNSKALSLATPPGACADRSRFLPATSWCWSERPCRRVRDKRFARYPVANRFPLATAPATCAGDHKYATLTA